MKKKYFGTDGIRGHVGDGMPGRGRRPDRDGARASVADPDRLDRRHRCRGAARDHRYLRRAAGGSQRREG